MTRYQPDNPLIVQGDHTVLVEVDSPRYVAARDALARFAELVKSPEHIHTYRITPLSIWNACAAGVTPEDIVQTLHRFSKYDVPQHVSVEIRDYASRYGRLQLLRDGEFLRLEANAPPLAEEISRNKHVAPLLTDRLSPPRSASPPRPRQAQAGAGADRLSRRRPGGIPRRRPVVDFAAGRGLAGLPFALRDYQREAAEIFHAAARPAAGRE